MRVRRILEFEGMRCRMGIHLCGGMFFVFKDNNSVLYVAVNSEKRGRETELTQKQKGSSRDPNRGSSLLPVRYERVVKM